MNNISDFKQRYPKKELFYLNLRKIQKAILKNDKVLKFIYKDYSMIPQYENIVNSNDKEPTIYSTKDFIAY